MPNFRKVMSWILLTTSSASLASTHPTPPTQPSLEVVKNFENFGLIGIAVSRDGRIFATAPAALVGDKVIEVDSATGAVNAYPNDDARQINSENLEPWFAPQALWIDDENDLWVLDSGRPTFPTTAPTGKPKLVRFDLSSNEVLRVYQFDNVVADDDSLNDLRIDHQRGYAYITNIGRRGSLVVLNLVTGKSRQVLIGHKSTRADTGVPFMLGSEPAIPKGNLPMIVHADGLALSPDKQWLYYRTLTDHNYWRIASDILSNDYMTEDQLSAQVQFLGKGPVTGGIIMDNNGTLYGGDLENGTVVAMTIDPVTKTLQSTVFIDAPGTLAWPDSFAIGNGYLYIADARLSETVFENHLPKRGLPTIFRVKLADETHSAN